MKHRINILAKLKDNHGVTAVIVALSIFTLLAFAALAIDLGYVMVTKNEVQNAADSAALAGARELGSIFAARSAANQWSTTLSDAEKNQISNVASIVGLKNKTSGRVPNFQSIVIDFWNYDTNNFESTPLNRIPNAVRVTARPSGIGAIPVGSIATFFATVFGINSVAVAATATAALTCPCESSPEAPFAIAQDSQYCTSTPVSVNFTSSGCGAWQSFGITNPNSTQIQEILNTYMTNHDPKCKDTGNDCKNAVLPGGIPYETSGYIPNLFNGNASQQCWDCLKSLYNCEKEADGHWHVTVPVVQVNCSSMNKASKIIGFATLDITGISSTKGYTGIGASCSPANGCINAVITCDAVVNVRGGCACYGTYGSIPGLVS